MRRKRCKGSAIRASFSFTPVKSPSNPLNDLKCISKEKEKELHKEYLLYKILHLLTLSKVVKLNRCLDVGNV